MESSYSDLPPELIAELSASAVKDTGAKRLERKIVGIIRDCEKSASVDDILIGLWRKHRIIQKRRFLQNKLWRMCQAGLIESVAGRKGQYLPRLDIEVNLPFDRVPTCSHDPGVGDGYICPICSKPGYDPSTESNEPDLTRQRR